MEKNDFEFKYVALSQEEKKEIESIKNSYIQKDKTISKLETLRKLDSKVKNLPLIIAIIFGGCSTLIFGLGLAMVLEWKLLIWGIVVMIVGFIPMLCTYPLYVLMSKNLKNKYSKEIIKLSDELLNDKN